MKKEKEMMRLIRGIWKKGTEDLSDIYELRREVFVEEQHIPENLEFVGDDEEYEHLIVYEDHEPVATGRMRFIDSETIRFGRICVRKEYRGMLLGDFAVKIMLEKAFQEGALEVVLDAQDGAVGFYKRLGFVQEEKVDEPSGILHWRMRADLLKRV